MVRRMVPFVCFVLLAVLWWSGSSRGQAYQPHERPLATLNKPEGMTCQ